MRSLTGWYQNLKKWQKGGLIGCAVGVLFAFIAIIEPGEGTIGGWIIHFHSIFFILLFTTFYSSEIVYGGGAGAIAIFYGGLGAVLGKIQQGGKPVIKWLLTALLVIFLLLFYMLSFI